MNISYDRVCDVFDSENVESIAFSVESKIMLVVFKTSASYRYYNVTQDIFGAIVSSENVGKTLYALVSKDPSGFPYEKVGE
jgi:KTSC domain